MVRLEARADPVALHEIDLDRTPSSDQPRRGAIARTAAGLMSAQAVSWLSTLLGVLFVPRYLGIAHYGVFIGANTVSDVVSTAAVFGTDNYIVREASRQPRSTSALVTLGTILRLLIAVAAYAPIALVLLFAGEFTQTTVTVYLLVAGATLGTLVQRAHLAGLQSQHRVGVAAVGSSIGFLAGQSLVIAGLVSGFGVVWIVVVNLATAAVVSGFTAWRFWTDIGGRPAASYQEVRRMVAACRSFAIWDIGLFVFRGADIVMLTLIVGAAAAGVSGFAFRLLSVPAILYTILTAAYYPSLASAAVNDRRWFSQTLRESAELMLIASIPISLLFIATAGDVVGMIGSEQYSQAALVLRIGAVSVPFVALSTALGIGLFCLDRQASWAAVAWIGVAANVAGDAIVIPLSNGLWGTPAAGAAAVTVLIQIYMCVAAVWMLRDSVDLRALASTLGKVVVCGIVLGFWLVEANLYASAFAAAISGVAVYAAMAFATGLLKTRTLYTIAISLRSRSASPAPVS